MGSRGKTSAQKVRGDAPEADDIMTFVLKTPMFALFFTCFLSVLFGGIVRINCSGTDESSPQAKNFFCPLHCRTWLLAHFHQARTAKSPGTFLISPGTNVPADTLK